MAAVPIIESVVESQVNDHVLVTTTTPSGFEAMEKRLGSRVDLCYVPYDIPSCVNRFLKTTQPKALFLMETELWPNLINRTAFRGTPVFLLNARLSEKSANGYARMGDLAQTMLRNITMVASQYQDTAKQFLSLGVTNERLVITGNVKFDLNVQDARLPDELNDIRGLKDAGYLVWIAGSTHSPEEDVVLDAHKSILEIVPDAKLIVAPRHTTRAEEILSLSQSRGLQACMLNNLDLSNDVIVVDRMGILFPLYQCASVAFVGGSLQHTGGHNPIEPAFFGLPVIMGPNRHNFTEVCTRFVDRDCLFTVNNATEVAERVLQFHKDPSARAGCSERAREVVHENQGALTQINTLVNRWLSEVDETEN